MTKNEAIQKVISVAVRNIGYHEVGNNRTKFTDGNWDNQFYGWELSGQPWCDVFADYCYCEPFGITKGKQLTYQTRGGSALCSASAQYYKDNGAFFSYPQPGDQAFFYNSGGINHTGIVETVNGSGQNWTSCTCIEGNTSDQVARRTYSRGSSAVAGFGRPKWSVVTNNNQDTEEEIVPMQPVIGVLRYGQKSEEVRELQKQLIKLGYDLGPDGADGDFGRKTRDAVKDFQGEHGLVKDGEVGELTRAAIKKALGEPETASDPKPTSTFKKGDKVKVKSGATWYNSKVQVPQFVLNDTWIIYAITNNRAVINKNAEGTRAIMSPIDASNLIKVKGD